MDPATCAVILLGLVVVVGPLVLAILAFVKTLVLRQRLEELEKSLQGRNARLGELADRVRKLESGQPSEPRVPAAPPIPPPPPPKAEPAIVAAEAPARVVEAPPPPPPPPRPREVPLQIPKEHVPLENLIGERILPRLGVAALVLGLGLLVWYSYGKLGPAGRVALAGAVGAGMVIGGVVLRRLDRLLLLGGCLVGGGWAVMYVTAYAAHFVAASRIVTSPLLGFLILLGVSAAALIHALRYRNEAIAGAAYLLTIVTLFLSPEPGPPAWLAMGLSGVTLVALAWKFRWIRLCTLGAALLYIAEATWLARTPPADLVPALAVLVALWLMWIMPDYFHRPASAVTRAFHGALVAINFAGLIVVGSLMQN